MKTWLYAAIVGIVAVPVFWFLSEAAFDGRARSVLWVDALVLAMVLGAIWPVARAGWKRYLQHVGLAIGAFLVVLLVAWLMLASQTGECPPTSAPLRVLSCPA